MVARIGEVVARVRVRRGLAAAELAARIERDVVLVRARAQRAHEQALITDGEARAMLGLEPIDPLPWTSPA